MQSEPNDGGRLSALLQQLPEPDVHTSQRRVATMIDATLASRNGNFSWWKRAVAIPVPAMAAAALLVAGAFLMVTLGDAGGPTEAGRSTVATNGAGVEDPLNIKVHVDASHTADLLDWLNEQDVGNVTIQLPDNATFDLLGEPVLVRPEELMIEPLEPAENERE